METGLVRRFSLHNEEFAFDLCRRPCVLLGETPIDHWWMPVTPLYGQRQQDSRPGHNRAEILRLYWAKVQHINATSVRAAQERYLLASLVPHVRVEGSRTIFADAFLRHGARSQQDEKIASLEAMLATAATTKLTRADFQHQSWQALGRPEFPADIQNVYDRLSHELLDHPCSMLSSGQHSEALEAVRQSWDRLMRTIARRAGHFEEKIVLDMLSYEARTAFHHCYSVTWATLIPLLGHEDQLTVESRAFLRLWHMDWRDSEFKTSLFHGHVFGLHPATSTFMQSRTGPRLLGDWLGNLESAELLGCVLNGLLIALFDYRRHRELAAESRPQSREWVSDDLEVVERIQVECRSGRPHRPTGDDRDEE